MANPRPKVTVASIKRVLENHGFRPCVIGNKMDGFAVRQTGFVVGRHVGLFSGFFVRYQGIDSKQIDVPQLIARYNEALQASDFPSSISTTDSEELIIKNA
jgi:hypothetical protein